MKSSKVCSAIGLTVVLTLLMGTAIESEAFVRTCQNQDAGEWEFGIAPSGCDAELFGDVPRVRLIYKDTIFDRTSQDATERRRYISQMHALIRDAVTDYIRRREPQVSDEDVEMWVHSILSVATQETYLSHYRIGLDSRLKLMTGDRVVSHGIMQINQEFHASRDQDNSFDLVGNLLYGIDHYYLEFTRARQAGCIRRRANESRAARFEALSRAAYSAYNGGPIAVCRWTNPRHPWSKNDKGYHKQYKTAPWREFVDDPRRASPVKTACLANGDDLCALAGEERAAYLMSRPLVFEDATCFLNTTGVYTCSNHLRTFQCFQGLKPEVFNARPLKLDVRDSRAQVRWVNDRDSLCRVGLPQLARIGDIIRVKKDVRLRKTVGGPVLTGVKTGTLVQVLDYEIEPGPKGDRHYRIRLGSVEGFIFAGGRGDHVAWSEVVAVVPRGRQVPLWIPRAGSVVEIRRAQGISVLSEAKDGAPVLGTLPVKTQVNVQSVVVRWAANEIYAQIQHRNGIGYIYVGRTYPDLSVPEWVRVLK
ncbi:MAG: hypothetical protein NDI61_02780 [Bdellovibrionaceae bacterium]|nr:hypothetical protein [Pseudobdellovibrionaceae bacterium]